MEEAYFEVGHSFEEKKIPEGVEIFLNVANACNSAMITIYKKNNRKPKASCCLYDTNKLITIPS